jgi:hypothetical protein
MFFYGRRKLVARPRRPKQEKASARAKTIGTETDEDKREIGICTSPVSAVKQRDHSSDPPAYLAVEAHFRFRPNRSYRIYVLPDELLFIQAGPAAGAQAKNSARQSELDALDLDELQELAERDDLEFRGRLEDGIEACIDAPGWWDRLSSPGQGWLRVRHPGQGEQRFQFLSVGEMKKAIELLSDTLGDRLDVNAVLDRRAGRFVRRS